jgi:DNA-binding response OmpR family regulator
MGRIDRWTGHPGTVRVLVVEDERRMAQALARGLRAEGCAVDVAFDGSRGFALARTGDHDAIVLDLMLPGMSGYQVCTALRAAQVWTPVLVLSAKDGEFDQADALDYGADDFLAKPFSYVVLLARLRALVRRGRPPRPSVLSAGDLTLDPSTRAVHRGGEPVELTPREFALLEYLLRHRGEVVSKTDLLTHVWDGPVDAVAASNVVEVYAGYLRRKVDTPFGRSAVQTVRGVGYRIAADGG